MYLSLFSYFCLYLLFLCGLVYLGFFGDSAGCDSTKCLNDEEEFDADDGLSKFTLDDAHPLNVSRDVLVFLHIQKTVRLTNLITYMLLF